MKVYVMNIPSSKQRLLEFRRDYPSFLPEATVWRALTGDEVTPPEWWQASKSNYAIGVNFKDILTSESDATEPIMIFEDDVIFVDDFQSKFEEFMEEVPGDWDMLFLGGDHIGVFFPEQVSEHVLKCKHTWAPHAVIINPVSIPTILEALSEEKPWPCDHRHECAIGMYMQKGLLTVYSPIDQMAGQRGGVESQNWDNFTRENDEYFSNYNYINLDKVIVKHGAPE